ncbi:XrtB/PEP-CTERM-associated polysaccharide biosynthesis outer membrane protein EpsL [Niveibacterium terrae]|uniref:XrtB/PEP-CTERM-associated polysaccharide biosynthesis outer membrane protein EpsL n=1 Tax=Niveibacterium terrae TaxID=3373598 RepID=UPI003A8E15C0
MKKTGKTPLSKACYLVAILVPAWASAENNDPLRLGAGVSWMSDSNLFRADSSTPDAVRSDRATSAFALLSAETTLSRQRLYADLNVGSVKFSKSSYLDYDTQDLSAGWSGEFPLRLRSGIDWKRSQTLASFADLGTPRRNLVRRDSLNGNFDLPFAGDWHLIAAGGGSQSRNSNAIDAVSDVDANSFEAGFRYATSYGNQFDVVLHSAHTRYPERSLNALFDTQYREQLADFRVQWAASGASRLVGHAGYLRRRNQNLDYRNFSGASFRLVHIWQASGSLGLNTTIYRDMGAAGDNEFDAVVSKGLRFEPGWELSSKTRLGAALEWAQRDYLGNVQEILFGAGAAGEARRDQTRSARLFVSYAPSRWASLSASWCGAKRESNRALRNYLDHSGTVNVQLLF